MEIFEKSGSTISHGTVCAPKQCSYQKEAKGIETPKMYSSRRCKNLTCAELQTTPSHVCHDRAENEICGNPGLPLPMVPCLHQSNVYIKRKLRVWRVIKCIPLVGTRNSLTCAGLQTTLSQVSKYRAENGNLRKSGSTISHGTVFAPKQCLYQKEATGIETPKMYFSRRCKNVTYLCGTANDPVSCMSVQGRQRKICENPGLLLLMVPCLRQSNVYIKRKLRVLRLQ